MDLQWIWYVLIGVLFTGYAILDGFDLGIGVLYPFVGRSSDERVVLRSAIGPIWDGNEVWLVTAGGALFAAFPIAYAFAFSGFYLAIMLVLFGLILRAVSLEFRHQGRDVGYGLGPRLLRRQPAAGAALRRRRRQHRARRAHGGRRRQHARCRPRLRRHVLPAAQPLRPAVRRARPEHVRHAGCGVGVGQEQGALHARMAKVALVVAGRLRGAARGHDRRHLVRGRGPRLQQPRQLLRLGGASSCSSRASRSPASAWSRDNDSGTFVGTSLSVLGLVTLWGAGAYPSLILERTGDVLGPGVTVEDLVVQPDAQGDADHQRSSSYRWCWPISSCLPHLLGPGEDRQSRVLSGRSSPS